MNSFLIKDLAKIIERDSKDATYKFALLKGTIDIIQENDNYKEVTGQTVTFPMGLMILKWIINHSGTFSIPIGLYNVMQTVGRFVTGSHSIIFRWAEFTSYISKEIIISTSEMISLLKSDFNEHDILQAKNYYSDMLKSEPLECVWTGNMITKDLHIDHMVPFVAYRNNDLWNLLPTLVGVNIRKSDRVPSDKILSVGAIRERIIGYWEILYREFADQFRTEMQVSLLGRKPFSNRS